MQKSSHSFSKKNCGCSNTCNHFLAWLPNEISLGSAFCRLRGLQASRSLTCQHQQRLIFLHDVGCKFCCVAAADILRRMKYSRRYKQYIPRLERNRWLSLHLVLERAFDHIDDLFTRVSVHAKCFPFRKVDAYLPGFLSFGAQIVTLQ